MKQPKQIYILLVLAIAIVFTCMQTGAASTENDDIRNYEKFFAEEDILNAWNFSANERDDYAGVYVDGDTIILLFKNDSIGLHEALSKCEKKSGVLIDDEKRLGSPIIVKSAVYRNSELRSVQDLLFENIGSVGLLTLGLNNKNNCIDVGISPDVPQEQIEKKLYDMIRSEIGLENRPGHDMLSFEIIPEEKRISYVTSINGNSELKTTYGNQVMYYSAAVGRYSNTYGAGFITTGHAPSVGDAVKYGSTTIGYVRKVNHDGTDDSAFVQFVSPHNWTSITTQYEEKVPSVPAQGVTIKVRGCRTTPYANATVVSNCYSYHNTGDGITWSDLLVVDYAVPGGDSGGAAYWKTIDGGRTTCVIGVISAANDTRTFIVKSGNVEDY